jgi:hypothetical protein
MRRLSKRAHANALRRHIAARVVTGLIVPAARYRLQCRQYFSMFGGASFAFAIGQAVANR